MLFFIYHLLRTQSGPKNVRAVTLLCFAHGRISLFPFGISEMQAHRGMTTIMAFKPGLLILWCPDRDFIHVIYRATANSQTFLTVTSVA